LKKRGILELPLLVMRGHHLSNKLLNTRQLHGSKKKRRPEGSCIAAGEHGDTRNKRKKGGWREVFWYYLISLEGMKNPIWGTKRGRTLTEGLGKEPEDTPR